MNARLAELRARRERLIATSAVQREEMAALLAPWRTRFALADKGIAALRYLRSHLGAVALIAAVLAARSPRRALRWAQRGLLAWRGYRFAAGLLRRSQRT